MLDVENVKIVSVILAAASTKIVTMFASTAAPDAISQWIERGGTTLAIMLLVYACRALRIALCDRQARLDAMHDEQLKLSADSAAAREKLTAALDSLSQKLSDK